MDKFTDVLVKLQNEGYDFSIFVRKKGESSGSDSVKFSHAYVTPAAKQLLPLNIWDLVEDSSILKHGLQPKVTKFNYETINLPLEDLDSLERYLKNAFKHLRQVPCKSIVKAWIKVIEPRKKTKYPYIKGELTKPDWWPRNVQHREPDHLQKDDRMRLMTSIILAVLPDQRYRTAFDDLRQTSLGLSLFKREPHKELVLKSIFDISQALCSDDGSRTVEVIDLAQFTARQTESHLRTVREVSIRTISSRNCCGNAEDVCDSSDQERAADSLPTLSEPVLLDSLVASDQNLLDVFGYSVVEESATPCHY
ncbi:hypothetical protein HG536_0C01720 [Torulaspora globosa]|uniref:Subtelomeric hrmA-associated cluster protein AFUB-079030/YDR124W-like helical bundle domain-containing protein n=1 Tax=Torulaspora globosa TaxID=48254 RepID=A0A7G3ZER8_9SACH|nr:uncharacterized protein HG536_0C01720 [Torulaspora globosa]QLL32004.1 hypothetical protein HG536_0C01720 [Torulaspora globosa]